MRHVRAEIGAYGRLQVLRDGFHEVHPDLLVTLLTASRVSCEHGLAVNILILKNTKFLYYLYYFNTKNTKNTKKGRRFCTKSSGESLRKESLRRREGRLHGTLRGRSGLSAMTKTDGDMGDSALF